jgi:uncharacterized protein YjiS (DUF1127 family)
MSKLVLLSAASSDSAAMEEAAGTVARIARAAVTRFRRDLAMRATLAQLSALDDRTLSDIGLHRSELASIAMHGRFKRRPF